MVASTSTNQNIVEESKTVVNESELDRIMFSDKKPLSGIDHKRQSQLLDDDVEAEQIIAEHLVIGGSGMKNIEGRTQSQQERFEVDINMSNQDNH